MRQDGEILLIGDDGSMAELVRKGLGRSPRTADSYFQAIVLAAEGRYSTAIANLAPVERQAAAMVRALREVSPQLRIVLYCQPYAEPLARQSGADDYLIYPPTIAELRSTLFNGRTLPAATDAELEQMLQTPTAAPATVQLPSAIVSAVVRAAAEGETQLHAVACEQIKKQLALTDVRLVSVGTTTPTELCIPLRHKQQQLAVLKVRPKPAPPTTAVLNEIAELLAPLLYLARSNRALRKLATTDELTGARNRRYVMQFLRQLLQRARREKFQVTVLMFDIDDFKNYNDRFGHATGDRIVVEMVELVRRCCRSHDVVGRIGGDEFVVIFWDAEDRRQPGSTHPQDAYQLCRRFVEAIETFKLPGLGRTGRGQLTISGGLATFPTDADSPEKLLAKADEALLAAKRSGKGRIYIVGPAAGETPPDTTGDMPS